MENLTKTILQILRESLTILAMPAEKQIKYNGPGCVSCDLLNDYDNAFSATISNIELSTSQKEILCKIDRTMNEMSEDDYECFNNKVLYRQAWNNLRSLAEHALSEFQWELKEFNEAQEVEPGLWRRPPL
ncbi:hypothetical protein L0Z72_06290 [candidate division KSB1 bacterium]|nr:hypothetical protein [candidate division KSB1 bacterium]